MSSKPAGRDEAVFILVMIFEARKGNNQDHSSKTILSYVQRVFDDVHWTLRKENFYDVLATKEDFVPGLPYRCVGAIAGQILYDACRQLLGPRWWPPSRFLLPAEQSSYPSLPQLTSRAGMCDVLTRRGPSAICFGLRQYSTSCLHPAQRCVTTRQMTDNIFEIETAALAQWACMRGGSGICVTDFVSAYSSVKHGRSSGYMKKQACLHF